MQVGQPTLSKPRSKAFPKKDRPESAPAGGRPHAFYNRCQPVRIPTFPSKLSAEEELVKLDEVIRRVMVKYNVPGAQLAVAKGGQLKLWKGYGVANKETGEAMTPWNVLRISSLSKIITGTAILKLVQVPTSQED